jgi:hypothetical protein
MDAMATKRKSVALSKEEWSSLKKYRAKFLTSVECAESIGISRQPLDRILLLGRGAPDSIDPILKALAKDAGEA